jgi:hypothetical protein
MFTRDHVDADPELSEGLARRRPDSCDDCAAKPLPQLRIRGMGVGYLEKIPPRGGAREGHRVDLSLSKGFNEDERRSHIAG